MDDNTKNKLKVDALLREYTEIRQESRTYEVLMIMCITLSALIFVVMFIASIFSHQYIFLFISPSFSIFFILLTMAILAYNTNLGLRSSQIEDLLKNILGEPTLQWEATTGIFRTASEDLLTTKVGRYWTMISILVIVVGIAPIIISLSYEYKEFRNSVGNFVQVWTIIGFNVVMASVTIYVGYSFFFKRGWENLKLPFLR